MTRDKKCTACPEHKRCKESYLSWVFFIIGLTATISIRAVMVLMEMNPAYGKAAWYIGVSGFFAFFIYRFRVAHTQAILIKQRDLIDKIIHHDQLTNEDYNLMGAILCRLSSNKERINYLFIFGLSAIALLLAIYTDLLK